MSNWGSEIELSELNKYFISEGISRRSSVVGIAGNDYFFQLRCERDYLQAYNTCPPLKAILAKKAKAFNSGRLVVYNTNTEKLATGRKNLYSLLKKPNILQSGDQFFAQQNIYIDLHGYCPVITMWPAGMRNVAGVEPYAIWNLPPWLFDLTYTTKWLNQFEQKGIYEKFYLFWNGQRLELDMRDVKFIFDDGIGTEDDSNLTIPDSRLVSLEYPVSNIVAAYKSRNTLITKRGAIGILSNEAEDESGAVSMKPGEKELLQKDFAKYGLVGQAFQVIVTDAKLKWQQMGFPTNELMLFEEIEDDMNRLCDAFGPPAALFSRTNDTTYDNKKQARKDLIENTIIPENKSRMQQFTEIIAPNDTVDITRDYSHLMIFQEDAKLRADSRLAIDQAAKLEYDSNLITLNQWRDKIGEPRAEGGDFLKGDAANTDPLAIRIGVGGTTALVGILANPSLSEEAKRNSLIVLFGLTAEDAALLVPETIVTFGSDETVEPVIE